MLSRIIFRIFVLTGSFLFMCYTPDMSIEQQLKRGRRTALRFKKETPILVTFNANRKLRDDAVTKCGKMGINLSEYLRICMEKLIELPIEYHIDKMYSQIIEEATKGVSKKPIE